MKRHMLTHTCHEPKFKCDVCDYGGQNACCLCYFEARSKEILEMHLETYESFKCKGIFVDKDSRVCHI
jgi:hypothetical protein